MGWDAMRPVRRQSNGQALVETALVMPLVLVLSLGVVQVALYAHAQDVVVTAVQEGARLASEDGRSLAEGSQRTRELVRAGLGDSVEPLRLDGRISVDTVDQYISRARVKYAAAGRQASNKAAMVARAIEDGLVRPEDVR